MYTVALTLNGKTETKSVTIEQDPRLQVSQSDRDKRRQAIDTLISLIREAEVARKKAVAIHSALVALTDGWKQPNAPAVPDAVRKNAEGLLARSKTVADRFEAPAGGGRGGGAGAPPPYSAPPVTQKIGRLLGTLDNFSGAPTSRQLAEADDASAQLKKDVAELNKLAADVPALNKSLSEAGVAYFNIPGI
jgi:hypothetical protein